MAKGAGDKKTVTVVQTGSPIGRRYDQEQTLKGLGLNVMEMTPQAHDRMLAETLFLTHYVAQALARGCFVRTDIDTLSFGFLMDAVESVKSDTELFKDVFAFNPYCEEIIARFEKAEAEVHVLLEKNFKATS